MITSKDHTLDVKTIHRSYIECMVLVPLWFGEKGSAAMKPKERSALLYPLDKLLGTEANVRILREMATNLAGWSSARQITERTCLTKTPVLISLQGLVQTGIVVKAGALRATVYGLNPTYPLSPIIVKLFQEEAGRFPKIREEIRTALSSFSNQMVSVWAYGSVARGEDRFDSDLDIAVIVEREEIGPVIAALRERLEAVQDWLAIRPSVIGLDGEDIQRLAAEQDPWWTSVVEDSSVIMGYGPKDVLSRITRRKRRLS